MPNWCECTLVITGPRRELKRFLSFAASSEGPLDMNKFIPYPKKYALLDAAYPLLGGENFEEKLKQYKKKFKVDKSGFALGGREWCIKRWGTKWNFVEVSLNQETDKLLYSFSTAWSPPVPVIRKMGKIFPKLKFSLTFQEEGMGYCGEEIVQGLKCKGSRGNL